MQESNQFALLRERRFAPYFLTQLLGAFNDNVYKNALVALVAFAAVREADANDALVINLSAGLFILPFFLFSAYAGQIADRHEKSWLIRRIKLAEIVIMACGAAAFALGSVPLLIAILFLMGTQSAFFGPIKYAILPQHLDEHELVGGNAMVELGTFLAILLGTIAGTALIAKSAPGSVVPVTIVLMLVAVGGWLASRRIPLTPASDPDLVPRFSPLRGTVSLVREVARERVVFQSILAISWFWFLGATYLAQFPVYARDVLGGNVDLFTTLLATFSIGIAAGSMLCERLSGGRIEIGLVPFGALGMTVFGLDLVFATPSVPALAALAATPVEAVVEGGAIALADVSTAPAGAGEGLGVGALLAAGGLWRILIDIALIGMFGGFYIVPLYALVQKRSDPARLARAMACNNILNALLMVLSAVFALALLALGASIAQLFLIMAIANALVAAHIFRLVPEFLMRFLIWLLVSTLYRVRTRGLDEHVPEAGAAVLVCNHVSFVDALILGGSVHRPVRFVMHRSIYRLPLLGFVFRTARAIPIAGRSEDPALYERAFEEMRAALDEGDLLCLFPEGGITRSGEIEPFRPGLLRLLETHPVPVVPMALSGLWGSLFSREGGRAFLKRPRRLFARIGLAAGEPFDPAGLSLEALRARVEALRGERR